MKIGLIDVDSHNFPNLALMKISAYHKAKGDTVEWCFPLDHYDIVYQSKVFDETYSLDINWLPNAYMTTPISKSSKHPERVGKLRGFPLCGKCGIQRDCKIRPCERFYKKQKDYSVILGIASDEKDRLLTNAANNKISILELLCIEEFQTYGVCTQENLLSPTYSFSERGGCWFCPNQKIQEIELLYRCFPHLWQELMEVQNMPNKIQDKFNRTQTLYDIEKQIKNGVQEKWFTGQLIQKGGDT